MNQISFEVSLLSLLFLPLLSVHVPDVWQTVLLPDSSVGQSHPSVLHYGQEENVFLPESD